jgi:hypothetical protein
MADISGNWDFHRWCPGERLIITNVGAPGALEEAVILLDNGVEVPINGLYNAATNAISFNDARQPAKRSTSASTPDSSCRPAKAAHARWPAPITRQNSSSSRGRDRSHAWRLEVSDSRPRLSPLDGTRCTRARSWSSSSRRRPAALEIRRCRRPLNCSGNPDQVRQLVSERRFELGEGGGGAVHQLRIQVTPARSGLSTMIWASCAAG